MGLRNDMDSLDRRMEQQRARGQGPTTGQKVEAALNVVRAFIALFFILILCVIVVLLAKACGA